MHVSLKYKVDFRMLSLMISLIFFLQGCNVREKTATVKIGICSDVHLATMHDSEKRLRTFIDSMKIARPDFIIELGDFELPKKGSGDYVKIWNSFKGNKYHVIGNHEMDGGKTLKDAISFWGMKSPYYSFTEKGFKFIVLNGNDKKDSTQRGYTSYMGKEQLKWLKKELGESKNPVIIFSHQGIGHDPGNPGERYSIENAEAVRKMFEDHNGKNKKSRIIACFNGHTHHDFTEEINGIGYITINSMSYKWLGEDYAYIRYSKEIDKDYKWIKYTAPYKDPLFTVVEISADGLIHISGKRSEYVGPSPWELSYPVHLKKYVRPEITERVLKF